MCASLARSVVTLVFATFAVSCTASNEAQAKRPVPCRLAGTAGTFHEQELVSDGLTRNYFLHVPASYDCNGEPMLVLVDLHGATDTPGRRGGGPPSRSRRLRRHARHRARASPGPLRCGRHVYRLDTGAL